MICLKNFLIIGVALILTLNSSSAESETSNLTLHQAAAEGNLKLVDSLLKQGAKVDSQGPYGCSPLHWAIMGSNPRSFEFPAFKHLKCAANPKVPVKGSKPNTAHRIQVINKLLQYGADINLECTDQRSSALVLALALPDNQIFDLLLKNGADVNEHYNYKGFPPLSAATKTEDYEAAKAILEHGGKINIPNLGMRNPIQVAAQLSCTEFLKLYLDTGVDLESFNSGHQHTPLHSAAMVGSLQNSALLLKHKNAINVQNHHGDTPLHLAARVGADKVVELLLRHGAKVDIRNKENQTPLHLVATTDANRESFDLLADEVKHLSCRKEKSPSANIEIPSVFKFKSVISHLLEAGASLEAKGSKNETPFWAAFNAGAYDRARVLARGKEIDQFSRDDIYWTACANVAKAGSAQDAKRLIEQAPSICRSSLDAMLIDAATHNNLDVLKYAALKGATSSSRDRGLAIAAKKGFSEIVKFLLKHGGNPNGKTDTKRGPLHDAAVFGHLEVCKLLLYKGADPNKQDGYGNTPLHLAVSENHVAIINLLLQKGADSSIKNMNGETPLDHAEQSRSPKAIMALKEASISRASKSSPYIAQAIANNNYQEAFKLIAAGFDVNLPNPIWPTKTPLQFAVEKGQLKLVETLLEHGAKFYAPQNGELDALSTAVASGNAKLVRLLLSHGAKKREDLLSLAAANGSVEVVQFLLNEGANINRLSSSNRTPLIYAISSEHWTVVEILIAAGAAYAKPDPAGWSALHSAIVKDPNQMGDIFRRLSFSSSLKKRLEEFPNRATEAILEEMLELGLSFNAETCIKYNCKSTMLEHLIMGEKPDTVMALIGFANEHSIDLFKSKDRSIYPIHLAAQEGHVDLVRRLLNLGFSVDSLTDNGKTPLCKSCELVSPGCHSEMVIFLLENGASVRYADKCKILCDLSNAFVQTYAFDQYVSNRIEYTAFEMLLHKGANPDLECNPADGTLLHNAVRTDDLRAVQILLDNKANPNLSNDRGTTPLHIAARGGIVSIVQMLLEHGALPNIKDEYDCTPLDFAKRRKHLSVIKQLTTVGATSGKCTDGLNG